jgi:hypothetical protein
LQEFKIFNLKKTKLLKAKIIKLFIKIISISQVTGELELIRNVVTHQHEMQFTTLWLMRINRRQHRLCGLDFLGVRIRKEGDDDENGSGLFIL